MNQQVFPDTLVAAAIAALRAVLPSQGLLLAVLIFQKHRALFANRYLALLMLSYTCVLVHLLLQDTGLYVSFPFLFLISGLSLAAMPLHYLYTRHLIYRSAKFGSAELLHYIPFILYECALFAAIVTEQMDFSMAGEVSATNTPLILRVYNVAVIIFGLLYLGLSFILIRRYNSHVKDVVSSIESVQLNWLQNITVMGFAAISLFCIEELFLVQGINLTNFILSSIGFALYVYSMGYLG